MQSLAAQYSVLQLAWYMLLQGCPRKPLPTAAARVLGQSWLSSGLAPTLVSPELGLVGDGWTVLLPGDLSSWGASNAMAESSGDPRSIATATKPTSSQTPSGVRSPASITFFEVGCPQIIAARHQTLNTECISHETAGNTCTKQHSCTSLHCCSMEETFLHRMWIPGVRVTLTAVLADGVTVGRLGASRLTTGQAGLMIE